MFQIVSRRTLSHRLLLALVLCAACNDATPLGSNPQDQVPTPVGAVARPSIRILSRYVCAVDVASGNSRCDRVREDSTTTRNPNGPRLTIFTGSNVEIRTSNKTYNEADSTYSAMVSVAHPDPGRRTVGTIDGVTVTGVKAFYLRKPAFDPYNVRTPGTSAPVSEPRWLYSARWLDTTTIRVKNADGADHFTNPNQSYHLYRQTLDAGETTEAKRWE